MSDNQIISTGYPARAPRSRVLMGAKLILNNGQSIIDCVIRDMSDGGTRVRISIPTVLPTRLEIFIAKSNMIYPAEVRWNRNSEAGLRFTGSGKVTTRRY